MKKIGYVLMCAVSCAQPDKYLRQQFTCLIIINNFFVYFHS